MSRATSRARTRLALTREAARLMYEEGYKEYFDAKRVAARRLFSRSGLRVRPRELPSNGEIREALLELADMIEGHERFDRLFAMRLLAHDVLEALEPFRPGLIGSVASGHVRRGSDIDIHVFAQDVEVVEAHLFRLGWAYECDEVEIMKNSIIKTYTHIHVVEFDFPVELSVYSPQERRVVSRSSIDGKPIRRLSLSHVCALIEHEHPTQWAAYLQSGEVRFQPDAVFVPPLLDP